MITRCNGTVAGRPCIFQAGHKEQCLASTFLPKPCGVQRHHLFCERPKGHEGPHRAMDRCEPQQWGRNLSADIFCDGTGKKWSTVLREHPPGGGAGVVVFEKHDMRSEYAAETCMEAAYRRFHGE